MARRHANRVGDLASVFTRLDELVLANSGEDAFDEVFKLVLARLWDEQSGGPSRFRTHPTPAETHREVTVLMGEAADHWPGVLDPDPRPALTPEHLHVCVEALARHHLSSSRFEVLDGFFEFMVSRAAKGAKGQFFTPRHVVELCVRLLRPGVTERVLDPACGSGAFLIHTLAAVREAHGLEATALRSYCATGLHGWDIDPRAVRVAAALMRLAGGAGAQVSRRNSLDRGTEPSVTEGYDVILTNPPFAGEVCEPAMLEGYALARGSTRIERDVLFVERCVDLLRPGGRMAMVLPHNKFAAESAGPLRRWLFDRCRVLGVVGLGRHTFLPHTHQKASVLLVQKRLPGEPMDTDEPIFFALSERDGKDARGRLVLRAGHDPTQPLWDRVDHDLGEVVVAFHRFCAGEGIAMGASPWR